MKRLELLHRLKTILLALEGKDMPYAYAILLECYEYIDSVGEVIKEKLENE